MHQIHLKEQDVLCVVRDGTAKVPADHNVPSASECLITLLFDKGRDVFFYRIALNPFDDKLDRLGLQILGNLRFVDLYLLFSHSIM